MEKVEIFFGKNISPRGEHILLRFRRDVRPLVSAGGIIETNKDEGRYIAIIEVIGSKVKDADFKVGDKIIFNPYDIKYVEEHETKQIYGIIKPDSVMAVYDIE